MPLSKRDFRARPGKTDRSVLIAALIVVSLGAVAITLYGIASTPEESRPRLTYLLHMKCAQCGYTFDILPRDFARQWKDVTDYQQKDRGKIHCPKCKARYSCAAMTRCPHCRKEFLEEPIISSPPGAGDPPKTICRYCKKDLAAPVGP